MRLLVIHQNFPGQFGYFVREWSKRPGWDVRGLGRDTAPGLPGFDKLIRYKLARSIRADQHLYLRQIEAARVKVVVASFMQPAAVFLKLPHGSERSSHVRG